MHRLIASSLLGTVAMLSAIAPASVPAQAAETSLDRTFRLEWSKAVVLASVLAGSFLVLTAPVPAAEAEVYTKETLDRYFTLEWSKAGRSVNGYVYNSSSRRAAHMQLLVEGVDASGKVVAKTTTWVRDVPPNNRAFFEVSVADTPSYRVSVLTFDWIEDRLDRRKAW